MLAQVSMIREAPAGLAPAGDALAADRVLRRRRQRVDAGAGVVVGFAQEVVVLLAGRVRADDREPVAGGGAPVAGAGREDEDVARRDLERLALRPAELDRRGPGDDRERLVRRGVEVVEVE